MRIFSRVNNQEIEYDEIVYIGPRTDWVDPQVTSIDFIAESQVDLPKIPVTNTFAFVKTKPVGAKNLSRIHAILLEELYYRD